MPNYILVVQILKIRVLHLWTFDIVVVLWRQGSSLCSDCSDCSDIYMGSSSSSSSSSQEYRYNIGIGGVRYSLGSGSFYTKLSILLNNKNTGDNRVRPFLNTWLPAFIVNKYCFNVYRIIFVSHLCASFIRNWCRSLHIPHSFLKKTLIFILNIRGWKISW